MIARVALRLLGGRVVLVAFLLLAGPAPASDPAQEPAFVVEVVDGDTVKIRLPSNRIETLRLIGLNTPETVDPRRAVQCFGREASAKAKELLDGKRVELEADPTQGDRDRYGRLLRYVWLPDGRNFAQVMIAEGYGHEYTYRLPYKYQEQFQSAQREAREQQRGLWSPVTCNGDTKQPAKNGQGVSPGSAVTDAAYPCQPSQIKGNRNSRIYHVPGQQHYGQTRANVQCFDSEGEAAAAGFRRARR